MKPKLHICSNPACRRKFTPDEDHAFGSACSAICARVFVATNPRRYHEPISGRPPTPHSKRGTDNRSRTE